MNKPAAKAMETVRVELGSRSYDIVVGAGILGQAGRLMAPILARPNAIIVSDETVAGLYLDPLAAAHS